MEAEPIHNLSDPDRRDDRSHLRRRVVAASRLGRRVTTAGWGRALDRLERVAGWLGLSDAAVLLALAAIVALGSALGVVAFYRAIDLAYRAFVAWPASLAGGRHLIVYRPLLTGAALAVAWALWRRGGRGSDGLTVPDVQRAVVRDGGRVPFVPTIVRTVASAITLGGGGSAGSEGPVAVLGAAIGSRLGRVFRFAAERTTVLVGAGAAAAIAAAFNAPLAGAFFALEEILGDFRVGSFPPVVVASVVGAIVSRAVFGNHPAFPIPSEYGYALLREVLVFFPILGVVCGAMSALFVRTYFGLGERIARGLRASSFAPWIVGAIVGLIVSASHGLLVGTGHLAIPIEAFGRLAWYGLLLLALGKVVVTTLTLHGGGSGGLFTPSLFVGAATGGAVGVALHGLFPGVPITPAAYAIVGMGALVAGATGAPITGILLVFEMTNDYAIVVPLMIAVAIAHLVARRLERDTLYSGWLRRRGEHLEHGADRDVLVGLTVADAYERDPVFVAEYAPVAQLVDDLGRHDQTVVPIIDDDGRYVGALTTADLGQVARAGHALDDVVLAADVAQPVATVSPDDSLLVAIRRLGVRGDGTIPVVDPSTGALTGVVTRSGILALYGRELAARERDAQR